jgi:homoserine/homoserine lactone efflux protein
MHTEAILAYSLIALLSILTPGPAVLLAIRNGAAFGVQAAVWSSLGNVSGLLLLSATAMLGLGALLNSSALLFTMVKLLGAIYLFYIGVRHFLGYSSVIGETASGAAIVPPRWRLFREAFLLAATNPKPILFFTALFPQFLNTEVTLFPQFLMLTGIFMAISFVTLMAYAYTSTHTKRFLRNLIIVKRINRIVGVAFIAFGGALLALRRHPTA